jgi:DNA processing protein
VTDLSPNTIDLLRLTLVPGLGPVLIARLLRQFGSARVVLETPAQQLRKVKGIGEGKADAIDQARKDLDGLVEQELAHLERSGVTLIPIGDPCYPSLLAHIDDPPLLLYARGTLVPTSLDRAMLAVVGSRKCSHYGLEQSARFASGLARSGVTIVSGGARGIDTAAHRGALDAGGRTIAVTGCGLGRCYPPENEALYERIAASGCVLSELPYMTPPNAENFPARNRIISGMAQGTLVIEAGHRSGSLITARLAAEDHGREVYAIPGRVDSPYSVGSLHLLKSGGATLVTEPADILHAYGELTTFDLGAPAWTAQDGASAGGLFEPSRATDAQTGAASRPASRASVASAPAPIGLDEVSARILEALDEPLSPDQLAQRTGLLPHELRAKLTMLEIQRRVRRVGTSLERAR